MAHGFYKLRVYSTYLLESRCETPRQTVGQADLIHGWIRSILSYSVRSPRRSTDPSVTLTSSLRSEKKEVNGRDDRKNDIYKRGARLANGGRKKK